MAENSKVFEEALVIIEGKGGKCFTNTCVNQYTQILIQCEHDHFWETAPKNIKNGRWCPHCYNDKRSSLKLNSINKIKEVRQFLLNKGGKLISNEYLGRHEPLIFECEFGHQWQSNWANILNGSWCHVCLNVKWITDNKSGRRRAVVTKYSLEDVQKIASNKGGKCLSDKYQKRMKFICALGHEWEATVGNIIGRNSWCPICSSSLYERICRLYFETLFKNKFPTSYPKWLRNKNNQQLELDGYCEELSLAFEHNGKQHYEIVNFNGKSNEFEKLQENDEIKKTLCIKNNVKLIIIPELFSKTKIDDLKDIIAKEYINLGGELPNEYNDIVIDYKLVYLTNKEEEKLFALKNVLLNKGYELLSTEYLGVYFKYNVRCLNCNVIKNSTYSTLLAHNCASCQGIKRRNHLDDAKQLALSRNGLCLSDDYTNNHTEMIWQCSKNHIWNSTYNQIQSGTWCPVCFENSRGQSKRLGIDVYRAVATNKGGRCLSDSITSCYNKLEWQCSIGHKWFARADMIKNTKQWCPECAKIRKQRASIGDNR
jgi:hypothetical protein